MIYWMFRILSTYPCDLRLLVSTGNPRWGTQTRTGPKPNELCLSFNHSV